MNILRKELSNLLLTNTPKYKIGRNAACKSAISLENLYPGSSLKLTTPSKSPTTEKEKFNGVIPVDQLKITCTRSTGAGGQNVNKINTKVDVRFHLESANWLSQEVKQKLAENHKNKISNEGYMIFRSEVTRSQQLNLADCLEKIRTAVRKMEEEQPVQNPDTPEKLRRRLEKAARERLLLKREKSQLKSARQGPSVREVL